MDSDGDGLRDDWERRYFGGLDTTDSPDTDSDGDSFTDGDEFAFASDPSDGRSIPGQPVSFGSAEIGGVATPTVTFRCCAGNGLEFSAELTQDLETWLSSDGVISEFGERSNLYDGHGALHISFALGEESRPFSQWLVRILSTDN